MLGKIAYIQHVDGNLDARSWEAITRHYTNIMGAPAIGRVWSIRRLNFDPGFQKYVDELVKASRNLLLTVRA